MSGITHVRLDVTLRYPDPTGQDHEANTAYLENLRQRLRTAAVGHDYCMTSQPLATVRHDVVGLG